MSETVTPRVWVGCLACYNDGRLTGDWVKAAEAVAYVPCERVTHEEWWVMDHENLPGVVECSPMHAQEVAEAITRAQSDGVPFAAIAAYIDDNNGDMSGVADLGERYAGEHEETWEAAYDWMEARIGESELARLQTLGLHIDWQQTAWNLSANGELYVLRRGGKSYAFTR